VAGADLLELVDPTGFPGWDESLAGHPEATFFHTASWARVLSLSYGYHPLYFRAIDAGKLAALLPFMEIRSCFTGTRGVSLPFSDACAPILPYGIGFEEAMVRVTALAESRGWRTIEIRGRVPGMENLPESAEFLSHDLDLTGGEEVLYSRFRQSVQRNIRKAEREGISVSEDRTPEGLREFYRLNCMTRREHGLPPQPVRFFENLRVDVMEKGYGSLLLARHKGSAVAGAVFLHFAGKAIYKYGASDRRYQALRPNSLVFRDGIRDLCGKGVRTLSFGRTDLHHDGLRQFKLSWGAVERTLQYARFDVTTKEYLSTKKHRATIPWGNTMSKLPLPVLRMIGRVAYRHLG